MTPELLVISALLTLIVVFAIWLVDQIERWL